MVERELTSVGDRALNKLERSANEAAFEVEEEGEVAVNAYAIQTHTESRDDDTAPTGTLQWVSWGRLLGFSSWGSWLELLPYVLGAVVLAGLAVLLTLRIAPAARGSGIPDVKAFFF